MRENAKSTKAPLILKQTPTVIAVTVFKCLRCRKDIPPGKPGRWCKECRENK